MYACMHVFTPDLVRQAAFTHDGEPVPLRVLLSAVSACRMCPSVYGPLKHTLHSHHAGGFIHPSDSKGYVSLALGSTQRGNAAINLAQCHAVAFVQWVLVGRCCSHRGRKDRWSAVCGG